MVTTFASIIAGAIGTGIIFIGARFLVAPRTAAAGYGVPAGENALSSAPWLHAKGVRDIASGLFIWILLANRVPHLLGAFLIAASVIPIGDAVIVLRSGGTRAAAYGIHGATAAIILAAGAALLLA
jgi:hypothetical protein